MLAIELDEVDLFNVMTDCAGETSKTYSTNIDKNISCIQLAKKHGSKNILKLLSS
jgi:hypothetical protein